MKIAIIGYGKMGKAIEALALQNGHSIGLIIDSHNVDDLAKDNLQLCDVAIEFTNPDSAVSNICSCIDAGIPIVSGSTGWQAKEPFVQEYCNAHNGCLIHASNFSIGVNIFFEINKKLAAVMQAQVGYTVSLTETHHTQKKDAPSGTAITLAEQIISAQPHKKEWILGVDALPHQVPIQSHRIDPTPGTHTVQYQSVNDNISITHTAHNRQGFAAGALLAAAFVINKKGIYSMAEVLTSVG